MEIGFIYSITCDVTENVYIGKTRNIKKRWSQHRSMLNTGNHHNRTLQLLWNAHALETLYNNRKVCIGFSFNIVVAYDDIKDSILSKCEAYYTVFYDSINVCPRLSTAFTPPLPNNKAITRSDYIPYNFSDLPPIEKTDLAKLIIKYGM